MQSLIETSINTQRFNEIPVIETIVIVASYKGILSKCHKNLNKQALRPKMLKTPKYKLPKPNCSAASLPPYITQTY